jgi:hypothetical protein
MPTETKFNLKRRVGISVYIEVFILIAIAMVGSGIVYSAVTRYENAATGPAISVSDATIRQGANQAVERVVLANTGTVAFSSLTLTNLGAPTGATYCLSQLNPSTGSLISSSCPAGLNPSVITLPTSLGPGQAVLVSVTVYGGMFTIGAAYTLIVSSGGAQASMQVLAVPA